MYTETIKTMDSIIEKNKEMIANNNAVITSNASTLSNIQEEIEKQKKINAILDNILM